MINTFHSFTGKRQSGYAILMVGAILLLIMTMLSFVLAGSIVTQQRTVSNDVRIGQAFSAAQAGLDYGITFIDQNYATLTDGQTVSGSLSDGSAYSVGFTFLGSKDLIKVVATGTSADSSATRIITQSVSYILDSGGSTNVPSVPVQLREEIEMTGNTRITNTETGFTITAGETADFNGNAKTILSSGASSDSNGIEVDVTQNDLTLSSMSDTDLQIQALGQLVTSFEAGADISYSNSSTYNYSSVLNGQQGIKVSITQTQGAAVINGNTTIGSSANPTTIYVDGDVDISGNTIIYGHVIATGEIKTSGNTKIYGNAVTSGTVDSSGNTRIEGLVFSLGEYESSGNAKIFGALISGGEVDTSGNTQITYDSSILTNSLSGFQSSGTGQYAKVPGSWNDMGL
jgi:Tfp pilus assembly protein PilX